jgi:Mycothiol maleylpyruvate isomerase N-terminal domain
VGSIVPNETVPPILCAHLLRKVDEKLIDLLGSLTGPEWDLQTLAPLWKVRDVTAHLLDTVLRKLSTVRDACCVETARLHSPQDVIALVNRLNQEGVIVYRRLSPRVLIDLMKDVCEQSARFHESLDPFAPAAFNVSWAGEATSLNWFDTARELTERWHHQQQIRMATNKPGLLTPELYHPVLDCFVRGLPYLYRDVAARLDTLLLLEISGECGGQWFLLKGVEGWRLVKGSIAERTSRVIVPQELAWQVFTKGIDRDSARAQIRIEGDRDLGEEVLHLTAIVG